MNNKIKIILFSIVSCLLITGCDSQKDSNTLIVGLSSDYPPFEFQQQDGKEIKIMGFDVDLANHLAEKMDKKLVIKDMSLYSLLASLQNKNLDIVISGISPTPERRNLVDFSDIYYESQISVLFDSKKNLIKDVNELKGKVVGVQTGSTMESYINDNKSFADTTVLSQDSNIQLIEHLKIGRIDAILLDLEQAIAFKKLSPNFEYLQLEVSNDYGFAVGINLKDVELKNKINELLAQMKQDGTIESLKKKWLVQQQAEQNNNDQSIRSDSLDTVNTGSTMQPSDSTKPGFYDRSINN